LRNSSSAIHLLGEAPSTEKFVEGAVLLGTYLTRYQ
jgi:hypothetical protein